MRTGASVGGGGRAVRAAVARAARMVAMLGLALMAPCAACGQSMAEPAQPVALARLVGDFTSTQRWEVETSDGVSAKLSVDDTPTGKALRLDYDFEKGAGFCLVRTPVYLELADNYQFSFAVWGKGPENNLEFKLLDRAKENVWWHVDRPMRWPAVPALKTLKKRQIDFAWGPTAGAPMREAAFLEFAVSAASGGKGVVYLRDLQYRELPVFGEYTGKPTATASSENDPKSGAMNVVDGKPGTFWWARATDEQPTLTIDYGQMRELGGLAITWPSGHYPLRTFIDLSEDGLTWWSGGVIEKARSLSDYVRLPNEACRYVRLRMSDKQGPGGIVVDEVRALPVSAGESTNGLFAAMAKDLPRGLLPRYFLGEQPYWTVVGAPGEPGEMLMSEDGTLELAKRACSVEPFLRAEGKLLTWADGTAVQTLDGGSLPIPTATRSADGLELAITAWAESSEGAVGATPGGNGYVRYTVTNRGTRPRNGDLLLAIRPFQVLPPTQQLNFAGGSAEIFLTEFSETTAIINRRQGIVFGTEPDLFVASNYHAGEALRIVTERGYSTDLPVVGNKEDALGIGSGLARYRFYLPAGAARSWYIAVPMTISQPDVDRPIVRPEGFPAATRDPGGGAFAKLCEERLVAARAAWGAALGKVAFTLPPEGRRLADTFRSQLGYVLVNRDGPALQPGSRTYERSWARDGSMTSAALLEAGLKDEARAWVDWFGSFQYESGKVPCVVDVRGPDPVPEHDSTGQYIWAVANYFAHTGDAAFLTAHWPRVQKGVAYIQSLRAQRMTEDYVGGSKSRQEPGKPAVPLTAFRGLMPESISHEGYSAKPMHSFWDDLFTLRGLRDAATIARAVGDAGKADEYDRAAADMAACVRSAYAATASAHGIDYLAGCVELGDFDSTSTTVALFPCDAADSTPPGMLERTFEKSWENFVARRDGGRWREYTPYELRHVGAYVRLGWKDRAWQALEFYFRHQRPQGWNQWAEVVWNDERAARFIGDMPHTWVGSDYLNSVCAMFVYQRRTPAGDALVLLGGVPEAWFANAEGVGATGFTTPYGTVGVLGARTPDGYGVRVSAGLRVPPGGLWIAPPDPAKKPSSATVNGRPATLNDRGEVRVDEVPAEVVIRQ